MTTMFQDCTGTIYQSSKQLTAQLVYTRYLFYIMPISAKHTSPEPTTGKGGVKNLFLNGILNSRSSEPNASHQRTMSSKFIKLKLSLSPLSCQFPQAFNLKFNFKLSRLRYLFATSGSLVPTRHQPR